MNGSPKPEVNSGIPGWSDRAAGAEVRFLGRSPGGGRSGEIEASWAGTARRIAKVRQVHGKTIVAGHSGDCGEADALWTDLPELALEVVTADCVPVLLASPGRVAAVHAGWRGFVAGVLEVALSGFENPETVLAWVGPAIGPCCYEVGDEVADLVVARSAPQVRVPGRGARPHLDLPLAAEIALRGVGVAEVRRLVCCTACHPEWLESYRRDGAAAGRNRSWIWLRGGSGVG